MTRIKKEVRVVPACLVRLKRQIEELEWILGESGFDASRWKSKITTERDEGRLVLGLAFRRRSGPTVRLSSVPDPDEEDFIGPRRRFWIDGSHWYDQHAVGTLKECFVPTEEERQIAELCDLAEDAAQRVETGEVEPLLRAIEKVRKSSCPIK